MNYCIKCVQPDTRPGIYFNEEDICGACLWKEELEKNIDWEGRQKELMQIVDNAKKKAKINRSNYECAIGVSGGKDSTFQALYARDVLGLRAFLVNSEPEGITEIGRHNIENLKQLGFDVISLRPNPKLMKKLIKRDFYKHLNPGKITEYSLYASTYIIAEEFNIPLIIQGENVGLTFGDSKTGLGTDGDALKANQSNTLASGIQEYIEDSFDYNDLYLFHYNDEALRKKGIVGIWLNYYVKEFSFQHNLKFSLKHGLKIRPVDSNFYDLGTYNRYSQLDGLLLEVNQMFKYVKFGFGQTTDHACYDIRAGLISRDEGIALVKEFDGKCGKQYIKRFCDSIGIDENEFWSVANSFRGDMWEKDGVGNWRLKNPIWKQEKGWEKINISHVIKRIRDFENADNETSIKMIR